MLQKALPGREKPKRDTGVEPVSSLPQDTIPHEFASTVENPWPVNSEIGSDLAHVIESWQALPSAIQEAILALVDAAARSST